MEINTDHLPVIYTLDILKNPKIVGRRPHRQAHQELQDILKRFKTELKTEFIKDIIHMAYLYER